MRPEDSALLASIRDALAKPFADPVNVSGAVMSRAAARAIERMFTRKAAAPLYPTAHNLRAEPSAGGFDAPRSFFQSDFDTSEGRADRQCVSPSDADVSFHHETACAAEGQHDHAA